MKVIKRDQRQADAGKLQQGFTLIELVIVLAVLGALAAIAVPQLTGLQEEADLSGTATTISSEASNTLAAEIARGEATDTSKGSGIDWAASDICSSIESNLSSVSGYSLTTDADPSVEVTVPTYDGSETGNDTCDLTTSSGGQ